MTEIRTYRDLIVWQKSMILVTEIYKASSGFPPSELYGLTIQLRRSALSIPSNIAEGYGRNATGDYKRFLQISVGSLFELQTQVEIAFNLNYLEKETFNILLAKANELEMMMLSLIRKID